LIINSIIFIVTGMLIFAVSVNNTYILH
jgi:hypothetical protein